ncbi:MAG: hypothetical protein RMJ05_05835 [Thermomicrobium sp.]|nr:hypothetical protein [Thermomicrobium sp.]MDW8006221.1 hypothetical protein [Thermomicrobium sp.]
MRWSFLTAWLLLLALGGASAMLFWSSFNRIVGGFGTGGDWARGSLGIIGVLLVLGLARWFLARTGVLGEVRDEVRRDRGVAGEGTERSGEHVAGGAER